MTSYERLLFYSHLPQEEDETISPDSVSANNNSVSLSTGERASEKSETVRLLERNSPTQRPPTTSNYDSKNARDTIIRSKRVVVDVSWPRVGAIHVLDAVVRYRRDLPVSLSLSIEIRGAEKIGMLPFGFSLLCCFVVSTLCLFLYYRLCAPY
jgi:hypothetical protein